MRAEICAPCCAQEREVTLECPFDCEHLRDARRHEKPPELDPASIPSPDIELGDRFLQENEPLILIAGRLLLAAAMDTEGAVDNDVREALDALVRTYRTAESGLIYETRPNNAVAAHVQARFQDQMSAFRERIAERSGVHSVRDKDLLGVLVFWQRMEWRNNNGKRKGRAFIESLLSLLPPDADQPPGEQPGRIILAP